jgi:hypothetical protein
MTDLPSKEHMDAKLDEEMKLLSVRETEYFKGIKIPIYLKTLRWEYENDVPFEAWVFADFKERNVGAAYCLGGYGKMGSPWGLIFFDDDSFGMDCGWYKNIKEMINDGWLSNDT